MPLLRASLLYGILTVVLTHPLAFRLSLMDAGDSAFFAWAIGWERHALLTGPSRLPHGNFFHPLRYTLGMDEPVLGTALLVAPLAVFTDDAVVLYNVARLLTFFTTALATWACARSLGCGEGPSLIAGAAFAFSPIRVDQIAHLSTLGTQWLPVVLLFAFRYFRAGRARDALLAAGAFVLEALACGYHGLIGLVVLPVAMLPLLTSRWRRLPIALAAAAAAGTFLLPLYLLHRAALDPFGYVRGAEETALYSASVESFLSTSSWNHVWGEVTAPFRRTHSNNLFPGLVVPVAALFGAAALVRRRARPSREAIALALLAAAAVAVALGPELHAFGRTLGPGPFALARELPVFRMIRVPSRAGPFLALALALLAAKALRVWQDRPFLLAVVGALAVAETVIAPIPMPAWAQVVDTTRPPPPVYAWLAAQPPGTPVVELPILDFEGITQRPAFHESIYMVRSTRHWQPMLNGYAGIEPAAYVDLREKANGFPSPEALDAFAARGARYVVLHRGGYGPNKWARIERDLPMFRESAPGAGTPAAFTRWRLREVARFDSDTVFELVVPAPPSGGAVP